MNKEKLERILSDLDMEILTNLKKDLAEEMSKPINERDENLISELEDMISQTEDEIISASKKRSLKSVMKMLDEYEAPKYIKLYKRLSVVAACFLVVLGINTVSMKTFGQNMFSATYQLTKGGITISVEESDGFVLDDISVESNEYADSIIFFYKKDDIILNFFYTSYKTNDEIPPIGIPTDSYNVTEEQINGRTTYILKEDKQFTAAFIDKRIKYRIFAEKLNYNECQKILDSLS